MSAARRPGKARGHRPSGDPACRPGPLKIESPDPAVAVERLPDNIQTRHKLRLHRTVVDLLQWNAACRDFSKIPASVAQNGKPKSSQPVQQAIPDCSRNLGARLLDVPTRLAAKGLSREPARRH